MDENKATGLDNISGKFLKDGVTVSAKTISQICNLSIKYSIFSSCCKIVKLKPLFKKGSKTDPKNYSPISLLALVSKIIEKVIHDQTQSFLDKNDISRQKFTDISQVLGNFFPTYLNSKLGAGFESALYIGMILIDLEKAFYTVNRDILLKKMELIGLLEKTTKWFKSICQIGSSKFILRILSQSLEPPMWSFSRILLGPLFFLLFINDIPQIVDF